MEFYVVCLVGCLGVELENFLNVVVFWVSRVCVKEIMKLDMEYVYDCFIMGFDKKFMVVSEKEKEMMVYYEVGYVFV